MSFSNRTQSVTSSRRSGKERRDPRPDLFRGHSYAESIRMRLITEPPVGFDEGETLVITFSLPWNWTDEEIEEEATKVLVWDEDVLKVINQVSKGVTTVTIAAKDMLKLNQEQRATGKFTTYEETEPRGIFILEPEGTIIHMKKEQHWHLRFTGCSDQPGGISKAEMIEGLRQTIEAEVNAENRLIDRNTMKWVSAETRGALTASRVWHLYLREQKLNGNSLTQNLINPWELQFEGGATYSSHNDSGQPTENTKREQRIEDGVKIRGPSIMETVINNAAAKRAAEMSEKTGREIRHMMSVHFFPRNALQMPDNGIPVRNAFGEVDQKLTAIRIVATQDAEWTKPAESMQQLTLARLDPVVAKTKVTEVRTRNGNTNLAVTMMILTGMNPGTNLQDLVGRDSTTATCRMWRRDDSMRPKEGSDYWKVNGTIHIRPSGTSNRAAQEELMDTLENIIKGTLDEATVNAMNNKKAADKVAEATARLMEAKAKERVSAIETKIREANQTARMNEQEEIREEWMASEREQEKEKAPQSDAAAAPEDDIWSRPIEIWLELEKQSTSVIYSLISEWANEKQIRTKHLGITHMVNYMVEVGKISPNLGLGNARVEMYQVAGKPLLAEVAMYVGG